MKASELVKKLNEMIEIHGDLEVTNFMDNIIDSITVNEGPAEDYFSLDDSGHDIIDVQNGEYDY